MLSAVLMAIVLVIVIPVGVLLACAAIAAVLGGVLRVDVEQRSDGSELVELNR